jgi:hypothetical protein
MANTIRSTRRPRPALSTIPAPAPDLHENELIRNYTRASEQLRAAMAAHEQARVALAGYRPEMTERTR